MPGHGTTGLVRRSVKLPCCCRCRARDDDEWDWSHQQQQVFMRLRLAPVSTSRLRRLSSADRRWRGRQWMDMGNASCQVPRRFWGGYRRPLCPPPVRKSDGSVGRPYLVCTAPSLSVPHSSRDPRSARHAGPPSQAGPGMWGRVLSRDGDGRRRVSSGRGLDEDGRTGHRRHFTSRFGRRGGRDTQTHRGCWSCMCVGCLWCCWMLSLGVGRQIVSVPHAT